MKAKRKSSFGLASVCFILTLSLALFVFQGHAAIPQQISYQGYLTNASGVPINGTLQITFRIYDVLLGGNALWTETQNNISVTHGVYNVILGSQTPINLSFNVPYFLEIEIGGEVLSPRRAITSVGYAFRASTVDSIGSHTHSGADITSGTVAEARIDSTIARDSEVTTAVNAHASRTDNPHSSTAAQVGAVALNQVSSITTSMIQDNAVTKAKLSATGGTSGQVLGTDGTNLAWQSISGGDNLGNHTATQNIRLSNSWLSGDGDNEGVFVSNGGNVGIGTATPNEKLEITGNLRLPPTTSSTGIFKSGTNTLIHTYGTNNFFAGVSAGNLSMTGAGNTAIGQGALWSNTTGHSSVSVGTSSLMVNTSGDSNAAVGSNALVSNTTASKNTAVGAAALLTQSYSNGDTAWDSHNTALGYEALFSNQPSSVNDGISNTAIGSRALRSNTVGFENTATGRGALFSNIDGSFNTATGAYSLRTNAAGNYNTANGAYALFFNTSGNYNTAGGAYALNENDIGNWNTAMGVCALCSNTTGDSNTASGSDALRLNDTGSNNTATGSDALRENTTGYENTANGSGAIFHNGTGFGNTAFGFQTLYSHVIGNYNTAVGHRAGHSNYSGSYNTFVGRDADASRGDLINATAIGERAIVDGDNKVRIGNEYVTHIGGQVGFSNDSDIREKKDIKEISFGLNFINSLRPVEFKMIKGNNRTDFGFIAQDIEALLGIEYNVVGISGGLDRILSLRYTDFIAPMVKAIQEQQVQIDYLLKKIEELEKKIDERK